MTRLHFCSQQLSYPLYLLNYGVLNVIYEINQSSSVLNFNGPGWLFKALAQMWLKIHQTERPESVCVGGGGGGGGIYTIFHPLAKPCTIRHTTACIIVLNLLEFSLGILLQ